MQWPIWKNDHDEAGLQGHHRHHQLKEKAAACTAQIFAHLQSLHANFCLDLHLGTFIFCFYSLYKISSLTIIAIKGPFNEAFNCNIMIRDTTETIESGPLCITDLFQSVAYFSFIIILLIVIS